MKTGVFHITYFDYDKSMYLHYAECNFRCMGCIRRLSIWDTHLDSRTIKILNKYYSGVDSLRLSISAFRNIVEFVRDVYGVKRAILGGGEPTTDIELVDELNILSSMDIEIRVLTNGYLLDRYINVLRDVDAHIVLSIKNIDVDRHLMYTGRDLETVLRNFEKAYREGLKISIETIFIPNLNDYSNIEALAKYISSIDRDIELIIDSYIPVPGAPWRRPIDEELENIYRATKKYLSNVYIRGSMLRKAKPLGEILLVHPFIPLRSLSLET